MQTYCARLYLTAKTSCVVMGVCGRDGVAVWTWRGEETALTSRGTVQGDSRDGDFRCGGNEAGVGDDAARPADETAM